MADDSPDIWGRDRVRSTKELKTPENVVLIQVPECSHTIIRVANGFILRYIVDGCVCDEVFEEPKYMTDEEARATALANCLFTAFAGDMQGKRRPGITLTVHKTGWEAEEDAIKLEMSHSRKE